MPSIDPTVQGVLDTVRARFAGVPFLALGQTVFWDEPTKAVWRRLLDLHLPEAHLIGGVHDTDYFAKTSAHIATDDKYAILPHDDGLTYDLWSAAGELSALFGSESIPTRHFFLEHGVPFDQLARSASGGKLAFYAALTAAWGWRGIVRSDSKNVVAADIPAIDYIDILLRQLDWGFEESLRCLQGDDLQRHGADVAQTVRGWVQSFLDGCDANCRLTDLYRTLLPHMYRLLLGDPPSHFDTANSADLFRLTPETADRPRFRVLEAFLDPRTRVAACHAYDRAVRGSGIYTLDAFGEGAIPFDIVVPQHGRGTLRLAPDSVSAQIGDRAWSAPGSPETAFDLALILYDAFGEKVDVVGKAIILIDMIGAEHLTVFHETASGYTGHTRQLNEGLAEAGIGLDLYPIVRLEYRTWDSLASAPEGIVFSLPKHLAAAFSAECVSAGEFARRWREVVAQQRRLLEESRTVRKPRDLMDFVEGRDPNCWCDRRADYDRSMQTLTEMAKRSDVLRKRTAEYRDQVRIWKLERQELERRSGEDWRAHLLPLLRDLDALGPEDASRTAIEASIARQTKIRASAFEERIAEVRDRIVATRRLVQDFRHERRALERDPAAMSARETIRRVLREAQLARAELVRNAYLTIDGLEHTNLRPTAWWLPLVDKSGRWFDAIVSTTRARFEFVWPE
jgi:hypothetical protein